MPTNRRTGELTANQLPDELELSDNDRRFLHFIRRVKWGAILVLIKDEVPVSCRVLTRDYRLDAELPDDVEIFVSDTGQGSWKQF
jgi:hypothetical protein